MKKKGVEEIDKNPVPVVVCVFWIIPRLYCVMSDPFFLNIAEGERKAVELMAEIKATCYAIGLNHVTWIRSYDWKIKIKYPGSYCNALGWFIFEIFLPLFFFLPFWVRNFPSHPLSEVNILTVLRRNRRHRTLIMQRVFNFKSSQCLWSLLCWIVLSKKVQCENEN